MIDPAYGPDEPPVGGRRPGTVTWEIASRLSGRLAASGAEVSMSRGPTTTPTGSERALLANELAVDVVVSIGVNAHHSPHAAGCSSYYFGAERTTSEIGRGLADLVQATIVMAGWVPDCRIHPMTWAILRETRMPALVVQPGFLTSPADAAKLVDPDAQDGLAHALAAALTDFYAGVGTARLASSHA